MRELSMANSAVALGVQNAEAVLAKDVLRLTLIPGSQPQLHVAGRALSLGYHIYRIAVQARRQPAHSPTIRSFTNVSTAQVRHFISAGCWRLKSDASNPRVARLERPATASACLTPVAGTPLDKLIQCIRCSKCPGKAPERVPGAKQHCLKAIFVQGCLLLRAVDSSDCGSYHTRQSPERLGCLQAGQEWPCRSNSPSMRLPRALPLQSLRAGLWRRNGGGNADPHHFLVALT